MQRIGKYEAYARWQIAVYQGAIYRDELEGGPREGTRD